MALERRPPEDLQRIFTAIEGTGRIASGWWIDAARILASEVGYLKKDLAECERGSRQLREDLAIERRSLAAERSRAVEAELRLLNELRGRS